MDIFETIETITFDEKENSNLKWKIDLRETIKDPSALLLVFTNLITIFLTIVQSWNFITIVWIYWCQSVVVAILHLIRIKTYQYRSLKGVYINNVPIESAEEFKSKILGYFTFFYLIYFFIGGILIILISNNFKMDNLNVDYDYYAIFLTAILFFINHLFSFFYNRNKEIKSQNIRKLVYFPILRIIPIHIVIILGMFVGKSIFPLFLLLKIIYDVSAHSIEHYEENSSVSPT